MDFNNLNCYIDHWDDLDYDGAIRVYQDLNVLGNYDVDGATQDRIVWRKIHEAKTHPGL